ncbi:hypothetical protein [Streptomyces apocyni]|uniref:hypothetical protein n=1 Tax=Streptomyces apocyni TaxID=2654677 RepID=UPI0012EA644F|nr:hypothetical protein [Streptomyces apocyni]
MTDQESGARVLAIVERGYRGALEKQFFDELYLATELHRQLGGLDILLRGPAVTYGLRADRVPPLRIGNRTVDTVSDPRPGLRALLEAGVTVWADEPDLAALGAAGNPDRLIEGVRIARDGELAVRWPEYDMVCFL